MQNLGQFIRRFFGFICLILFVIIFSNESFAIIKAKRLNDGYEYSIKVENVLFSNTSIHGMNFVEAKLVGVEGKEGIFYKEGFPELPVIRFYVSGDVSVRTSVPAINVIEEKKVYIKPAQPSQPKIKNYTAPFVINKLFYKSDAFWPEKVYDVAVTGSVNGKVKKLVTLYPMSYNPKTGEYKLRTNFIIRVRNPEQKNEKGKDTFAFIVGSDFTDSPSLKTYMRHKERLGYDVKVLNVNSDVDATVIRNKLKEIYSNPAFNLQYALIIGDAESVGSFRSNIISGVTDHYFRTLDTNDYLSDINAPDIGVGRIAVKNEEQLAAVLAKYLKYEKGEFSNENWIKKISFLATNDRYIVAEGSHNYAIENYTATKGYVGFFPRANLAGGDQLYAITHKVPNDIVQKAIKEGRSIINYSGHGANTFWDNPRVSQDNVRAMRNADALPFVISNACITGDFRIDESFAETWQRHPYGAIMFWGSMDSTYWDEDDILEKRMYDGIFREGFLTFTDITQYSLSEHWRHYGGAGRSKYYWETYTTFGDPSINLRTENTVAPQINGPSVIPIGLTTVAYTITGNGGVPLKGARVAISLRDSSYSVSGLTDSSGKVDFDLHEGTNTNSIYDVSVSGGNLRITYAKLETISPDGAFIGIIDHIANGRDSAIVSAGEGVNIGLTLENFGMVGTSGGAVVIKAIKGPAKLVSASTTFSAIGPQQRITIGGASLRFEVLPTATQNDFVSVLFEWKTGEGQTGTVTKAFKVIRGNLGLNTIDFGTPGAPDRGGINPGSRGDIFITLTNTGTESLVNADLTPSALRCISGVSGVISIDNLMPGQTKRFETPLSVIVDSSCVSGSEAVLGLSGSYQSRAGRLQISAKRAFIVGVLSKRQHEFSNFNLPIPDGGDPVVKELVVSEGGVISEIGVQIKIDHTYIGDLIVKIIHPSGVEVLLHNRTGGGDNNIDKTYGLDGVAHAALDVLKGLQTKGTWKLSVQDKASRDSGSAKYVKLIFKGYLE